MIRQATIDDLNNIFVLAQDFHDEMNWPENFDKATFVGMWGKFIQGRIGVIFILEIDRQIVGILGALLYIDPMTGTKHAQEIFWFVDKSHRGRGVLLLKAYDEWQRNEHCTIATIAHMLNFMPDKLNKVYRRYGYEPVEVHYRKELKPCLQG